MAPRIVSWSDQKTHISPVLSSAASVISFDSTFAVSDTCPSHSQMSPTASEAPGLPRDQFGSKHASPPRFSEEGRTPGGGHASFDDSFVRHDVYFFKDGNVTFLIDGTLYCVHQYFFSRDSIYFSTRFAKLGIQDHEALPTIISIGDVERNDFEALLSVLYPANFEANQLSYKQWKSVLHLSTRWGFTSLRKLALKSIKPPTPHDQLILARTYSVDQWVLPALTALCSRTLPLNLDEAQQMRMEDVVLVGSVREEIRDGAFRVDMADIPYHIEMVQAGRPIPPVDSKVYWDKPKSGTTGQGSVSMMASVADPNVETMRRLVAQAAKECADAEERAHKMLEEIARAKEKVDARAENATAEARKAEVNAKREAAPRARAEAAAKGMAEAEAEQGKLEAEAKAKEMARAKREAGVKAKREAEAEAKKMAWEAEAKAKREAGTKAKEIARAKREAEAKSKREADAKAALEAEVKAKREADAEAKKMAWEAEAKAKREADAKAKEVWIANARAEAEAEAEAEEEMRRLHW